MTENTSEFNCDKCSSDLKISQVGILTSLDDSCDFMTPMICYCTECMYDRLIEILNKMDIHKALHKDYSFIERHLDNFLQMHPNYQEVKLLLTAIKRYEHRMNKV
jgi:hypothetical protein